jgi:hypothetical protein
MMRSVKIKTFIAIAFCAALSLLSVVIFAQQSREAYVKAIEAELFNAPATTYKLRAMYNGKGFEFCNYSKVRVTGYRLGCVKQKKNELRIVSERDFQTTSLKSQDENVECQFWSSNHGFFPTGECEKGKLAVIEVSLEDGTTWKLK